MVASAIMLIINLVTRSSVADGDDKTAPSAIIPHTRPILTDAIFPNLVWKGGKTAEAVGSGSIFHPSHGHVITQPKKNVPVSGVQ